MRGGEEAINGFIIRLFPLFGIGPCALEGPDILWSRREPNEIQEEAPQEDCRISLGGVRQAFLFKST